MRLKVLYRSVGGLTGQNFSLAIAFPKYRVFLYNTTDRSASVDVYAYLIH